MENKITSGIYFVFIGLVLLLHNLDIISFNFWATLKYWPLLIVIIGINLIAQNKVYGDYLKIGSNVLFLGWILYVGISAPKTDWSNQLFKNVDISIENDDPTLHEVHTEFDSSLEASTLEFNGGAGKFEFNVQKGAHLVSARAKTDDMGVNMTTEKEGNRQVVTINAKPTSRSKQANTVAVYLNPDVLWNLDLNYGAANIEGDLSALNFKNVELNSGASRVQLTLGMPRSGVSKIDISTGASNIDLRIPHDAAIQVEYSSVLSNNSFEGLDVKEKGRAQTANYETAEHKFKIELEGAANNFKIKRY